MKDSVSYTANKSEDVSNHLISEDDNEHITEEHLYHGYPEKRYKAVHGLNTQTYRLTTAILGILCAVLISTIIGLFISYKGLGEKHIVLSQNSSETNSNLEQLKANYDQLTAALMKVQKSFQEAVSAKDSMQMERERERAGKELLQRQKEALMKQETSLQTRITMLERNCERCPVGWELLHSTCYFFAPIETAEKLSWHRSREECNKTGADLAMVDSQEKQEFISRILKLKGTSSRSWHLSGYWIGLTDIKTEGVWKWVNGTELTKGFWSDGEPNDQYSAEDCAATYPKENPLKTWNDAPCGYILKWICELKLQEP